MTKTDQRVDQKTKTDQKPDRGVDRRTLTLTPYQAARLGEAIAQVQAAREILNAVTAFVLDAHGLNPEATVAEMRLDGQVLSVAIPKAALRREEA